MQITVALPAGWAQLATQIQLTEFNAVLKRILSGQLAAPPDPGTGPDQSTFSLDDALPLPPDPESIQSIARRTMALFVQAQNAAGAETQQLKNAGIFARMSQDAKLSLKIWAGLLIPIILVGVAIWLLVRSGASSRAAGGFEGWKAGA